MAGSEKTKKRRRQRRDSEIRLLFVKIHGEAERQAGRQVKSGDNRSSTSKAMLLYGKSDNAHCFHRIAWLTTERSRIDESEHDLK